MERVGEKEQMESPTESQQTISDDDEIDYSIKPDFYDSDLDAKDELWVHKKRQGRYSDAVLSCPACFTTLCLECQRKPFSRVLYLNLLGKKSLEQNRDSQWPKWQAVNTELDWPENLETTA